MLKTEYIVVIPMNLHKHKWYALEQDSKSFKPWSTKIRINPEGKSLIMKSSPDLTFYKLNHIVSVQVLSFPKVFR